MKPIIYFLITSIACLFATSLLLQGCGTRKKQTQCCTSSPDSRVQPATQESPLVSPYSEVAPIVLYQTKGDYRTLVPVQLRGGSVISYPSRVDLGTPEHFATPILLPSGYLVDRRGITRNTAFLHLTYEQYYNLPQDPSASEILRWVYDRDPLTFLALCDRRHFSQFTEEEFERYIAQGMPGAEIIIQK